MDIAMAQQNSTSASNPFSLQQARKADHFATPTNPQLERSAIGPAPGSASGGKKTEKVALLKINDTSKNLGGPSSSSCKLPTTISVSGPGLPSKNQQVAFKGVVLFATNERAIPGAAIITAPVTNNSAKSGDSGNSEGKRNLKTKKIAPAISTPITARKGFVTAFPHSKPSTLFPKITGNIDLIESRYRVDNRKRNSNHAINILRDDANRKISFIGTVKLHGQHADVVINPDNTIRLQSRNKPLLDKNNDIMGFAVAMFSLENNLLKLKERIVDRWITINHAGSPSDTYSLVIAGEWVGPGVQKKVALDKLPRKYFVITSISLNKVWLDDQLYSDIDDVDAGIVHVARGGFFFQELDVTDLESCHERMMAHTLEIEKKCPFAQHFGIIGRGEGIVWKAAQPLGKDPRMWYKTKGPDFAVTKTAELPKTIAVGMDEDMIERTRQFAYATTTEPRLDQAWSVLKLEYKLPMDKTTLKKFMQWVSDDILSEEKARIKSCKVNEQYLLKCIRWMAEMWYEKRLEENTKLQVPPVAPVALGTKKAEVEVVGVGNGVHLLPDPKGVNAPAVKAVSDWW